MNQGWAILWSFTLAWLLCGCPPLGWNRRWDRSKDKMKFSEPPEWQDCEEEQFRVFGTAAFHGGPMDGHYIDLETAPEILRLRRTNDESGIPVTIAYQLFDCDPDQPDYVFIGEMAE